MALRRGRGGTSSLFLLSRDEHETNGKREDEGGKQRRNDHEESSQVEALASVFHGAALSWILVCLAMKFSSAGCEY